MSGLLEIMSSFQNQHIGYDAVQKDESWIWVPLNFLSWKLIGLFGLLLMKAWVVFIIEDMDTFEFGIVLVKLHPIM